MRTLFIQTRETTEGTALYFKNPLKQEQTLLYQKKTLIYSIQYISDQFTQANMFTIFKFPNSTTAEIVNAGNKFGNI